MVAGFHFEPYLGVLIKEVNRMPTGRPSQEGSRSICAIAEELALRTLRIIETVRRSLALENIEGSQQTGTRISLLVRWRLLHFVDTESLIPTWTNHHYARICLYAWSLHRHSNPFLLLSWLTQAIMCPSRGPDQVAFPAGSSLVL